MNKEIKKKWVEALRSGKYEQGKRRLREGDAFCCLGVLCDIADPEGWAEGWGGLYLHGGNGGTLSEKMYYVTGVYRSGQLDKPVTYKGAKFISLASLNDEGATFEEIADVIEEQF